MLDISMLISDRLGGKNFGKDTTLYKFAKIKKAKAEAKLNNPTMSIIDMGVGEPDLPADPIIIDILKNEAGKPENRLYADNGIVEYQEAAANYLRELYRVHNINPTEEIVHGIGSKPILAMLPLCFINPGDITLATVPGYPVMSTYTEYLGGKVYNLPLLEENNFYPDLSMIPNDILKRAKLLYINYPNNPTGQVASIEFYTRIVDFAHQNRIIVISDAAYAGVTFDDYSPLSFLSIDGAKEIGVEIHSMSKAFNMTGWRLAFIAGNKDIIKAYATVKDNTDSGQFRAIQKAGVFALSHRNITKTINDRYSRRFEMLIEALREIGFNASKPKGSFYCYVKSPSGTKNGITFTSAEEASDYLIKKALVSTVPWDDAGSYLRFSVTFEAKDYEEEKKVIHEMKKRLKSLELIFD